jgi:hypothetical protein
MGNEITFLLFIILDDLISRQTRQYAVIEIAAVYIKIPAYAASLHHCNKTMLPCKVGIIFFVARILDLFLPQRFTECYYTRSLFKVFILKKKFIQVKQVRYKLTQFLVESGTQRQQ